jgi:hydrogenase-4 membrane subunit HyfE
MEREELYEWIALILAILLWWPLILFGWFPLPYKIFVYVFSAVILVGLLIRRIRRLREGLSYSQEILESQRKAAGPPPLGGPPEGKK